MFLWPVWRQFYKEILTTHAFFLVRRTMKVQRVPGKCNKLCGMQESVKLAGSISCFTVKFQSRASLSICDKSMASKILHTTLEQEYLTLIFLSFISSFWCRKMIYGNMKTNKLRNDLPVIKNCLAKLYVWRRPWANEQSFVWMQHRVLSTKTYVRFVVATKTNLQ